MSYTISAIPPSPPRTPPPVSDEPKDNEKEKQEEKKKSVNVYFRSWLHSDFNKCPACDEDICHCVLYFDWLIGKNKKNPSMHRVPQSHMKRILYHEYEQVSNFVHYVYDRSVGDIAYPHEPFKRRVIPQCLEGMVENWVRNEYARQYRDWLWEQDIDSRVSLSGQKRTYRAFKEESSTLTENGETDEDPKVEQFNADEMKKRYEEEVETRLANLAYEPKHCPMCSVELDLRSL